MPERALYLESEDTGSILASTGQVAAKSVAFRQTNTAMHVMHLPVKKNGYHHPPATLSPVAG